jgi:hypothetical protein
VTDGESIWLGFDLEKKGKHAIRSAFVCRLRKNYCQRAGNVSRRRLCFASRAANSARCCTTMLLLTLPSRRAGHQSWPARPEHAPPELFPPRGDTRVAPFLDNQRLGPYIALIRSLQDHRCLSMKNVFEVLRQKELELARVEKEVEALRIAAPLLSEDKEPTTETPRPTLTTTHPQQPTRDRAAVS